MAFAFGISVIAMVYSIGSISGGHINPAITLGIFLSGRISAKDATMYILFQTTGAIIASSILWFLAKDSGSTTTLTGANGFAKGRMAAAFVAETVFTFIFVLVVLGVTAKNGQNKFAGVTIGFALVMIHIVCIPITGTSVNPARSVGPALFEGAHAIS